MASLSFADLHEVSGAIAVLERHAQAGAIQLDMAEINGHPRKRRADKKAAVDRKWMGEQTGKVLATLKEQIEPVSASQLATEAGVAENSIRAQLSVLAKHGLAMVSGLGPKQETGRAPRLWSATPEANVVG